VGEAPERPYHFDGAADLSYPAHGYTNMLAEPGYIACGRSNHAVQLMRTTSRAKPRYFTDADSRLGTRVGLARRRDSPLFRIFVKILGSFGSLAPPKMVPPGS
jgi:hypothetical protein